MAYIGADAPADLSCTDSDLAWDGFSRKRNTSTGAARPSLHATYDKYSLLYTRIVDRRRTRGSTVALRAQVVSRLVPAKLEGKAVTAPPRPARIEPVPLTTLVARADARLVPARDGDPADVMVTGATLRGQHVLPGDLFAALPGARVHGVEFAAQAIAAGAVAILTDPDGLRHETLAAAAVPVIVHPEPRSILGALAAWIYGEPSLRMAVLGVTGTSGKTTTAYMIEAGLSAAGHRTGLIGTVETRIAGERIASAFTTPEAPDLQALFAVMAERGVTHVPMEVSSHALALGRVDGTRFAVGAFTNLSQDHLDFHRDMEDYFQAKALLFDGRSTTEVVCVDGEWGGRLVGAHTVTVSLAGTADWTASGISTTVSGEQSFTVHGPDGLSFPVTLPLPGAFNVANALVAAACLHASRCRPRVDRRPGSPPSRCPGRMERVDIGPGASPPSSTTRTSPRRVALALDAMRVRRPTGAADRRAGLRRRPRHAASGR